jgi:hypothetical protein
MYDTNLIYRYDRKDFDDDFIHSHSLNIQQIVSFESMLFFYYFRLSDILVHGIYLFFFCLDHFHFLVHMHI